MRPYKDVKTGEEARGDGELQEEVGERRGRVVLPS